VFYRTNHALVSAEELPDELKHGDLIISLLNGSIFKENEKGPKHVGSLMSPVRPILWNRLVHKRFYLFAAVLRYCYVQKNLTTF
jgi:hypothetical protein